MSKKKQHKYDYKNEVEYIDFNAEDKDLDTIRVYLPKTPAWETIDNYGLPPKDQYFKHEVLPLKLRELQDERDEKGNFLTQDEIWDIINEQRDYYKEEIRWIKKQWHRRIFGYWVFINGKATFIEGWHYVFLNFWELPEGLPEYRDRDRRWFIFAKSIQKDPYMYGFQYIKHRREGATSKASCVNYCIASMLIRGRTGIQSMTEKSAEDVFQKHVVAGWRTMPFFFKPNTGNSDDPKKALLFSSIAKKGLKGQKKASRKSLMTDISYRSSGPKAFDGTQLWFFHNDETGKTVECNIVERWRTVKLTLSKGAGIKIHGFSIHTTTVGEVERGGGEALRELCNQSKYSQRNKNNQTASGLCILFIPSSDGLEGFIGPYGESVIDTPNEEQAKFIGKTYGAKEHIANTIEHLKKLDNKDELSDFIREHPENFRSAFRSSGKDSFFNIPKIEDRLDELQGMPNAVIRGDFEWVGQRFKSRVRFVPNAETGKFKLSKVLSEQESNRVTFSHEQDSYIALNPIFCAGGDPMKANETKSKKNSKAAGAVFWGHDINLDPFEKPIKDWVSNRIVCTYIDRPMDKDIYNEDMIMMCIYYGCPMYAETNVPDLKEAFIKLGYGGMLVHKYDVEKEKYEQIAGSATSTGSKQQIFKEIQRYINQHCHRDRHADFLNQVAEIGGVEEMTKYDLFAAVGYAMIGSLQYIYDIQQVDKDFSGNNLTFVRKFNYTQR